MLFFHIITAHYDCIHHFCDSSSENSSHDIYELNKEVQSSAIELKFTNLSKEFRLPEYKKRLIKSKVFKFISNTSGHAYATIVSTTKNYHPQVNLYQKRKNKYTLMDIKHDAEFMILKNRSYIIEVGVDQKVNTEPFPNIYEGSFIVIISSKVKSIQNILVLDSIMIGMRGYEGVASFEDTGALLLNHPKYHSTNQGVLSYAITPFYDSKDQKISLYYRGGVDVYSGAYKRTTEIQVRCNENARSTKVYYGIQVGKKRYKYRVDSKRICELTNLLK
ncbi:hypothetical protein GINT2_001149 [Glugoides intestinalis]